MTFTELTQSISAKGYHYSDETIMNYYLSLLSKPFVILSGISGSGKSKIAELFSLSLSSDGIKRYELIPVMPSWRDSKGLFGFHNLIDNTYSITPIIKVFLRALKDSSNPYFVILDEMNLAKVEQYFADYLSIIESRRVTNNNDEETRVKDCYINNLNLKLSEAIILSAIDINKPTELLDISEYRKNLFSVKWKEQNFHGEEENWTPQYRTELNQKTKGVPSRLAGKVFDGNGSGKYKLKSALSKEEQKIVDKLRLLYNSLHSNIVQDNIILHNNTRCISCDANTPCECTECNYDNSEKYLCPKICSDNTFFVPPEIPIPLNVFTVGTVNIDETTFMFSPKVLDRCNVIEFNDIDILNAYSLPNSVKSKLKNADKFEQFAYQTRDFEISLKAQCARTIDVDKFANTFPELVTDLFEIFNAFKRYNMHFGYRVINEISCYMNNAAQYLDKATMPIAFDLQLCQKVLPKLSGTYDTLWEPLIDMLSLCFKTTMNLKASSISELESETDMAISSVQNNIDKLIDKFKYPRVANKILYKLSELDTVGFTAAIK